jgi:hypothetical protein
MEALKRLIDGNDALSPLPPGENKRKSKLPTVLSRVGRLMKSNFVDTTNKKTKHSPTTVPAPPAKQQQMHQVVTPEALVGRTSGLYQEAMHDAIQNSIVLQYTMIAEVKNVSNTNGASGQQGCRRSITTCAFPFIPKRRS